MKAKGLRPLDMIVSREMTLDEIADYADGCSQLLFTKYENVVSNFEAFSNDEAKCGVPSEFVERVRRLTLHQTDAKNGNMNEVPAKNQGAV